MRLSALAVLIVVAAGACASSARMRAAVQEPSADPFTLAPGESRDVEGAGFTLTFEAVPEDSRCPTGVTCIWEGDAVVRISIAASGAEPATYTLHTNAGFAREAVHASIRVRLVALSPHPTADGPVSPPDYRATFAIGP